jgi:TolA-binding protein
MLAAARAALAERRFPEARRRAEALLQLRTSTNLRAAALLVAADAAAGMRSYRDAADRYGEFLSKYEGRPEASRVMIALGWAQLRAGERARARRSWTQMADRFPAAPRAPMALLLAAEVANEAGDTGAAGSLRDRIISRYPSTLEAGTARLDRSIVALRGRREAEAVRDLDDAVRVHGTSAVHHRRRTMEALVTPGAEAALETPDVDVVVAEHPIETFAAAFLGLGDRENAPYVLHGLSLVAAADDGWSHAVVAGLVHRLVAEFPGYPEAPALLARVARAAVSAGQWPMARWAYETLVTRYPGNPISARARLELAEGLIRAGAPADARDHLALAAAVGGAERVRALRLLAGVEETLGHRDNVRAALQQVVEAADGEVASEAAYRLGRMLSAEGQHAAAVEWHLTAAYLAESSRWGRHALLEAGRSLTALQRTREALVVYRKLMPKAFVRGANRAVLAAPPSIRVADPEDRVVQAEAAYGIAEILAGVGDQEAALDMYLTAAHLTAGTRAEDRALVGAIRSFVTMGDRASAETIYRRLQDSADRDPAVLAEARKNLGRRGSTAEQGGGSALPRGVLE